jgi:hypothetical protein
MFVQQEFAFKNEAGHGHRRLSHEHATNASVCAWDEGVGAAHVDSHEEHACVEQISRSPQLRALDDGKASLIVWYIHQEPELLDGCFSLFWKIETFFVEDSDDFMCYLMTPVNHTKPAEGRDQARLASSYIQVNTWIVIA